MEEWASDSLFPVIPNIRPPLMLKHSRRFRQTGAILWAPALPHILENTA
jgi:hypothetical protein